MFVIYAFVDENNRPYFLDYTDDFQEAWKRHSSRANYADEPEYYYTKKLMKKGFPLSLEILERDIYNETMAIDRMLFWINKLTSQGILLVNRFFDEEGNVLSNSPYIAFKNAQRPDLKKIFDEGRRKGAEACRGRKASKERVELLSKLYTGAGNPRTLVFLFISRQKTKYLVIGEFKRFCVSRGLSWRVLFQKLKHGKCKYKNWTVERLGKFSELKDTLMFKQLAKECKHIIDKSFKL